MFVCRVSRKRNMQGVEMKRRSFLGGLGVLPVFFTRPLFAKAEDQKKLSRDRLTEPIHRTTKPDNEARKIAEESAIDRKIEEELGYYRIQSRASRALIDLGGFTHEEAAECRKAICKRLPSVKKYREDFIHGQYQCRGMYIFDSVENATRIWCAIELSYRGLWRHSGDDVRAGYVWTDGFEFFGIDLEKEILKTKFPLGGTVAVYANDSLSPFGTTGEVCDYVSMGDYNCLVEVRFNNDPADRAAFAPKFLKLIV